VGCIVMGCVMVFVFMCVLHGLEISLAGFKVVVVSVVCSVGVCVSCTVVSVSWVWLGFCGERGFYCAVCCVWQGFPGALVPHGGVVGVGWPVFFHEFSVVGCRVLCGCCVMYRCGYCVMYGCVFHVCVLCCSVYCVREVDVCF